MKVRELTDWLEGEYPGNMAEDWDNVGLLVGDDGQEVHHVFLALDLTEAVLEEAVKAQADMIITHHPMIFRGMKKINNHDFTGRKVLSLIRHNISYFAMHTNYDVIGMADLSADYLKLQETKVPKQYFRYEIIESAYTIISKEGEEFLKRLRKEGVQIFLDDFGTGISTFETVRDYTFDALKMDMGFVKKIGKDPKRDAIVISIIDMAHRMGMKVVAEGIENKQQSEFLCNHGCDYLQGYYYYKPMSAEEFSKLLDK